MTTTSKTTATTGRAPAVHRARRRAVVVAGAVAAALGVWLVAVPLLGVDLQVQPNGGRAQAVGVGEVVVASLAAALLGWALLALLERRTARALTLWTLAAVAVLLLSLGAPLTTARTASAAIVLVALHLTVAAVVIVGLRRTSPLSGTGSAA